MADDLRPFVEMRADAQSKAAGVIARALQDAWRLGYESARADAERHANEGMEVLAEWLRARTDVQRESGD
jgi:hypothetical protein